MKPDRGDEALRRFRVSIRGARYFLTLTTEARTEGLTGAPATAIREEVLGCENAGHWTVLGGVIMPDHLHLLVELTGELPLSRTVARLKSKTRASLAAAGLRWQGNFYEHRLRPADPVESVLRYIYLNPYRAKLIGMSQAWPWFWCNTDVASWFHPALAPDNKPFPEWLR